MLKKLNADLLDQDTELNICEASFPAPFRAGLEFSSPARGTWNIVHTGMLIPESHQIFVCAYGCLRGVVLTAAEMNALGRYSSISISEENVLNGGMEELMINGVSEIIENLSTRPRAILLFISCQHFFLAYDQQFVFDTLSQKFPDICFIDCYMIPTLRKSGLTPDQKMRIQLYKALQKPKAHDPKKVNLMGSNLPLYEKAELRDWLLKNGIKLCEIQSCNTFDEYLKMAEADLNLYYEPLAKMAAEDLSERLGTESCYLSFSFNEEELMKGYQKLAAALSLPAPGFSEEREEAKKAILHAKEVLKDTEIVLDYTFTFRILSLARMLIEQGFHVTTVYADSFAADDEADFYLLRKLCPELRIRPTARPEMRFLHEESEVLALGQKAAWLSGTDHFVNVAESGGYFGFRGISAIMELMEDAFFNKKDRKEFIRKKGLGCESCI